MTKLTYIIYDMLSTVIAVLSARTKPRPSDIELQHIDTEIVTGIETAHLSWKITEQSCRKLLSKG